jgi:hypothetical protein
MTSAVDPTKPETGNASTSSVRANFQTIKDEIDALQALPGPTYRLLFYLKNADYQSAAVQNFTPVNPAPGRYRPDRMINVMRSGAYVPTIAGIVAATDVMGTGWSMFNIASAPPTFVGSMKNTNTVISTAAYEMSGTPTLTMTTPNTVPELVDIYIFGHELPTL